MSRTQKDQFLSSLEPAVHVFRKHVELGNTIRVITHNDADGLSSGGILSIMVYRAGASFKTSCHKKLDEKTINVIAKENPSIVMFSDLGSGYLKDLNKAFPNSDIIILDHHLYENFTPLKNMIHVNPLIYGIDGSREIASSGICYLFARAIDPVNIDLCCLGLIGALGDQQDKGIQKSLQGMNTMIEAEAIERGYLKKHIGIIFYGYETRPLAKAISYTTSPFIPGLSGNEGNCTAFLNKIGIPIKEDEKLRTLADLNEEEKRSLFSALSNHLVSQGYSTEVIHQLLGNIYTFRLEEQGTPQRSGREYASLLNACGRMERASLGLSICLGDRGKAMDEAIQTLEKYRKSIGSGLEWIIESKALEERDYIYVIKAEDNIEETVIGVVSSIYLGNGNLSKEKPIISTALDSDGQIKVSARGTEYLLKKGIHLGELMQRAAESVKGGGGGHDVAAGAFIPNEREEEFIKEVNQLVGERFK